MTKTMAKLLTFWIPSRHYRRKVRFLLQGGKHIYKKQDEQIKQYDISVDSLIVFLVPQHDWITGGVLSIFSIAKNSRSFEYIHQSKVIMMTEPNREGETYCKQTKFRNAENIFRFSQIIEFKDLVNLIIHIPEAASPKFYENLSSHERNMLRNIKNLQINIINQNNLLMPAKSEYKDLWQLTKNVTQTVGYIKDCTNDYATSQGVPLIYLPPYLDLSEYPALDYSKKEKLIIYSNDTIELKIEIIAKVRSELPEYRVIEINNMSFDTFMDLATRARYTISFGEGLDYYFIHTVTQNGLTFINYNAPLFPLENFAKLPTVFMSQDEMLHHIVDKINYYDNYPEKYYLLNLEIKNLLARSYSKEIYLSALEQFYNKKFTHYPQAK